MVLVVFAALLSYGESSVANPPFSRRDISRFNILTNGCTPYFGSILLGTTNQDVVDNMPGRFGFYGSGPLNMYWDVEGVVDEEGVGLDGDYEGHAFIMQAYYGGIRLLVSDLSVASGVISRDRDKEVLQITKATAQFKVPLAFSSGVIKTNRADAAVLEFYIDGTNEVLKIRMTE